MSQAAGKLQTDFIWVDFSCNDILWTLLSVRERIKGIKSKPWFEYTISRVKILVVIATLQFGIKGDNRDTSLMMNMHEGKCLWFQDVSAHKHVKDETPENVLQLIRTGSHVWLPRQQSGQGTWKLNYIATFDVKSRGLVVSKKHYSTTTTTGTGMSWYCWCFWSRVTISDVALCDWLLWST